MHISTSLHTLTLTKNKSKIKDPFEKFCHPTKSQSWTPSSSLKSTLRAIKLSESLPTTEWTNKECRNYLFARYILMKYSGREAIERARLFEGEGMHLCVLGENGWMEDLEMIIFEKDERGGSEKKEVEEGKGERKPELEKGDERGDEKGEEDEDEKRLMRGYSGYASSVEARHSGELEEHPLLGRKDGNKNMESATRKRGKEIGKEGAVLRRR